MRKCYLAALIREKDAVLNALQRTGAVEVKTSAPAEGTQPAVFAGEDLRARLNGAETALAILSNAADAYNKEHKIKTDNCKDGFVVPYAEFMSAGEKREEAEELISRINSLTDEKNELKARLSRAGRSVDTARRYAPTVLPFSDFSSTQHVRVKFGYASAAVGETIQKLFENEPLVAVQSSPAEDGYLLLIAAHASVADEAEGKLSNLDFTPCPYTHALTGEENLKEAELEKSKIETALQENAAAMSALIPSLRALKVYCDYLSYELEKAELSEKMRETERTFLLEAYVPSGAEKAIEEELSRTTSAVYLEFSDVEEDEMPPTLTKNNPLVENFEAITNMYSPPNAREFDPNTIMAFFYSLFMGFIMADIGYGILMVLFGGFFHLKKRGTNEGFSRLAGVFTIGGIFAIGWGILFNSLFGIQILPFTVMPDAQKAMWSLMGIKIPSVLIIAMEIGIVQLFAGYVCKAIQCWRRKQILDGILDGVVWALFSVGVGLALVGLIDEANIGILATVGGIMAGACLVIAVLTAGRKEKLLGKFTKGFGAAYGVINYASDILSYARLFGLMLSGAVIAQIVSGYALTGITDPVTGEITTVGMIVSGNAGMVILGVVLLVAGHVLNLALSLLGAYIHDARLQYVEFYGRFYEGEGELFAPLGSKQKYIKVKRELPTQNTASVKG